MSAKKVLEAVVFMCMIQIICIGLDSDIASGDGFDGALRYLDWNTFQGSSNQDEGFGVAANGTSIYSCGWSRSNWGNSPVRSYSGDYDGYVVKHDGDGNRVAHTFLGGTGTDRAWDIEVVDGYVYVAGYSEATW